MSTHSFILTKRRSINPSLLALLGGVLISLQLMAPSVALASPVRVAASPPPSDRAFARAEVSVVRVVVSYATLPPPAIACTGLGVLVGSGPSSGSPDMVNWVLTDGDLVNPTKASCGGRGGEKIGTIDLWPNNVYTNAPTSNPPNAVPLGSVNCQKSNVPCTLTQSNGFFHPLGNGAVLFPFRSPLAQPFADIATVDKTEHLGINLTDTTGNSPQAHLSPTNQPGSYLNPGQVPANNITSGQNERGMPIVNSAGQLVGIQLASTVAVTLTEASAFLARQPGTHSNPLHDHWNRGIDEYYAQHYPAAQREFTAAKNASFMAPAVFLTDIGNKLKSESGQLSGSGTNKLTPTREITIFDIPLLWLLSVAGLVVLIALLVLGGLIVRRARRRQELAPFHADVAEAQRIAEMEVQRQQQAQAAPVANKVSTPRPQSVSTVPCPNCRQPVQFNAEYCPNCRYLLSPSASGLHLQAKPPTPAVSDAPTLVSPSAQPTPQPVQPLAVSDIPTVQFTPAGSVDTQKTQPYNVEQLSGRNLSLAVGTRSDPGIKRKYKPNEDSLFAMQGPRTHGSQPQQFGLFVVADGMGGQANGQDASRLAIQTIINYVLPVLSGGQEMSDEEYIKLLSDGVQQANQAVYKHNQEQRLDMGTTMTGALVVGSTAYVVNVGDSRTYLYREPDGLSKITRDHSVVASLVDAGVIKPDDIYTHPKRNQIYRSLGEKAVVEVDTFKVQLQPGDKLLLCSDGLWDMVRDPDIQQLMRTPVPDPAQTGNALIKAALDGGGEDNVSVIVVHVTEATRQTGVTGIQLLAKPDTVSVPNM